MMGAVQSDDSIDEQKHQTSARRNAHGVLIAIAVATQPFVSISQKWCDFCRWRVIFRDIFGIAWGAGGGRRSTDMHQEVLHSRHIRYPVACFFE